ncbi:MAG: hypothetical protein ACP5NE_02730 [Candidatus Micrarchaeia archaeon]
MALFGSVIYASIIVLVACSALLARYISFSSQELSFSSSYESVVSLESFSLGASFSMPLQNSSPAQLSEWLAAINASAEADNLEVRISNSILIAKSAIYPGAYTAIKLN